MPPRACGRRGARAGSPPAYPPSVGLRIGFARSPVLSFKCHTTRGGTVALGCLRKVRVSNAPATMMASMYEIVLLGRQGHFGRAVKEMDLKSIGLCPQGFESPRCRFLAAASQNSGHQRRGVMRAQTPQLAFCLCLCSFVTMLSLGGVMICAAIKGCSHLPGLA